MAKKLNTETEAAETEAVETEVVETEKSELEKLAERVAALEQKIYGNPA